MSSNITLNKKYQQIIKTATDLFILHGIKRVTIEEICKSANVSKMTFYKFFRNKIELLKQVYIAATDEGYRVSDNIMAQDIPYEERLKQLIKYKIEIIRKWGGQFVDDLLEIPELQPFIQEMIRRNLNKTLEIFNQGRKEGAIQENITPDFFQFLIDHMVIMRDNEKLKNIFPDISQRIEVLINSLFYGVLKQNYADKEA